MIIRCASVQIVVFAFNKLLAKICKDGGLGCKRIAGTINKRGGFGVLLK